MSSSSLAGIRGPASVTDNALTRWDGTTWQIVQDSDSTLDDSEVLTLGPSTAQLLVAGTSPSVVVSGVTLSPKAILNTASSIQPNLAMLRAATTQTAAPTFNFLRAGGSQGSESVVKNSWSLGIFSGSGYDGTDYAAGAQIDIQVDEADTGTADVAANSMGSKIRFLTSRRGTQNPTLSAQVRHNGALQLSNAITLLTTPSAGCLEADADVLYYSNEDFSRGVCISEYVTRINSAFTLNATTTEQPMFPTGQQTLSLTTGVYYYECVGALSSMSGSSGNAAFDLVGAGSALLAQTLNVLDGMDAASNTANANSGSFNTAAQTPASMIVAAVGTEMGFRIHGTFAVTASGTINPSLTLVTAAAAVVAAGSYFRCHPEGALNATCTGPWT